MTSVEIVATRASVAGESVGSTHGRKLWAHVGTASSSRPTHSQAKSVSRAMPITVGTKNDVTRSAKA